MSVEYLNLMGSFVESEPTRRSILPPIKFLNRYSRGKPMFPRQATLMKIFFLDLEEMTDYDHMVIEQWMESTRNGGEVQIPLDLYDRIETCRKEGRRHFKEIIYCGGRRGGKGYLGGKIAEYKIYQMLELGNPQRYYAIEESKDMYLDVLATQFSQAQGMLYNDIKDAVLSNDYISPYIYSTSNLEQMIQTPADIAREELLKSRQSRSWSLRSSVATIHIRPSAASSSSIRGRASFMQCFDEFAHGLDTQGSSSSSAIYEAATPSLFQFDKDGLIYIPSSPWSETGKFYERYQAAFAMENGKAVNPEIFAIRIPSWGPYEDWQYDKRLKKALILPPSKSREMRQKELANPETFNVEFRANFAKTENAYLQGPVIDKIFMPYPSAENNRNTPKTRGDIRVQYRAHADAGRSQDNFCFALGHKEIGEDGYAHAYIDLVKVWQPSDFPIDDDGVRRIDYVQVIEWMCEVFKRFYVTKFTMDQWNSGMFIDQLKNDSMKGLFLNKSMAVACDNHTTSSNFQRWERFKTACYQEWVHAPWVEDDIMGIGPTCLLDLELRYLTVKNGNKVDHPDSGIWQHNDLSDSASTVVADLLADQIDAFSSGDMTRVVGAAQGGYNTGGGFVFGSNADIYSQMAQSSKEYFEKAGYGHFY